MSISEVNYQNNLGSLCHQRHDGAVPACLITNIKADKVLFSNTNDTNKNVWSVEGLSIYLQRFWSTSTARITLIPKLESVYSPTPNLPEIQEGQSLLPEDEICIYLGYLPVIREAELQDIIDGKLIRVYIGSIDLIASVSTPSGVRLTIECRDRMKYLMDTNVTLDPNFTEDNKNWFISAGAGKNTAVSRSDLILAVSRFGIGDVTLNSSSKANLNGKSIKEGYIYDLERITQGNRRATIKGQLPPPNIFYICPIKEAYGEIPLKAKVRNQPLSVEEDMTFHIYTSRLGYKQDKIEREFTIQNQIPIELIKHLSMQEPYPTEVFCNHMDGHFYYAPRTNDYSGLNDPARFHRTYYCRTIPEQVGTVEGLQPTFRARSFVTEQLFKNIDCEVTTNFDYQSIFSKVDKNQMCINFKDEFSSIALKTNYFVSSSSPGGPVTGSSVALHFSIRPAFLRGKNIAGRNHFIYDETIQGIADASAVALQTARTQSKELKTASMSVIGDPTFTPGEVVQIVGSPLYPESYNLKTIVDERESYIEYETAMLESYFSLVDASLRSVPADTKQGYTLIDSVSIEKASSGFERAEQGKIKFNVVNQNEDTTKYYAAGADSKTASWVEGSKDSKQGGFTQAPRSLFRVEGVRHSFTSGGSQGWTTELALVSPFV
jgi:hypothetical protein